MSQVQRSNAEELEKRVEQLEQENRELREMIEKQQDNTVTKLTINHLIAELVNDKSVITDFMASPDEHFDLVSDVGRRVNSNEEAIKRLQSEVNEVHDGSVDGPAQAWNAIVEAANRLNTDANHGLPNNRVKLYKENIAQATGKTKKMAGNYIEMFGREGSQHKKQGTEYVRYQRGSAGNKGAARKKSLIIDLDVWGEDDD